MLLPSCHLPAELCNSHIAARAPSAEHRAPSSPRIEHRANANECVAGNAQSRHSSALHASMRAVMVGPCRQWRPWQRHPWHCNHSHILRCRYPSDSPLHSPSYDHSSLTDVSADLSLTHSVLPPVTCGSSTWRTSSTESGKVATRHIHSNMSDQPMHTAWNLPTCPTLCCACT